MGLKLVYFSYCFQLIFINPSCRDRKISRPRSFSLDSTSVSLARKAVSALTIQFSNGREFYSGRASRGCREFLVLSSIPLVLCDFKLFLLFAFFSHVRAFFLTERNVPFLSLARSPFLFRKRENRLFLTKDGLDLRIIPRLKIETVLHGKIRFGRSHTRGYLRKKGGIAFYILSSVVFVIASFP